MMTGVARARVEAHRGTKREGMRGVGIADDDGHRLGGQRSDRLVGGDVHGHGRGERTGTNASTSAAVRAANDIFAIMRDLQKNVERVRRDEEYRKAGRPGESEEA